MKDRLINQLMSREGVEDIVKTFTRENIDICFVGGCIRDVLVGIEGQDIDFAIFCKPEETVKILQKNDIKFEDYGKKYGSIIAKINNKKFEITSLREDFNQIGRDTDVKFTDDQQKDALRRDFTINAMYLSVDGTFYDYFNGKQDLAENKLKFIGDISESVKQDYLRIFRYYRFLGIFEKPQIIKGYESVLHQYCHQAFQNLSNDLIRKEILKMFNNFFPINSFCNYTNKKEKNYWVRITKQHFEDTKYDLGLNKCLSKIDLFFSK